MKKLIILFIFSFLLGLPSSNAQINFSEMLQPNKIAKDEVSKLYFIDFWATWCAPCIHVSKYLTVLQEQYPDDFYVISLTQENPEKVRKFLLKHQTKLAVAIDFDGENFYKNGISSLPSGTLLNAQGSILWEGHPAELKSDMISRFLRKNNKEIAIQELITFNKPVEDQEFITYKPLYNFEIFKDDNVTGFKIIQSEEFFEITGKLSQILAFANKSHESQFRLGQGLDRNYKMYVKKDSEEYFNLTVLILKNLKLKQKVKSETKQVLQLSGKKPAFWDTYQFDFENTSKIYEIGKMDLKANNVSTEELGFILGIATNKPVITNFSSDSKTTHDWQIHFKFFDLMKSDLLDNYGILIEEAEMEIPVFKITKKSSF